MLRRRDRHLALVLAGMLALNVLTAFLAISAVCVYRKRFRILSESTLTSCKASEKASVEAASSALLLADLVRDRPVSDSTEYVSPPRVVGYGKTRTSKAFYLYRDVEEDGVVRREFIQRIPIPGK